MAWEIPPLRDDMTLLERFSRWVQLKLYRFEMTFGVYIFEPVEKFIFYSFTFLLCSLLAIGVILYLPQHLWFILERGMFYLVGDSGGVEPGAGLANGANQAANPSLVREVLEAATAATMKAAEAVAEASRGAAREL